MVTGRLWSLALVGAMSLGEPVALALQSRVPEIESARRAYWEGRFDQSVEQLRPLIDQLDDKAALRDAAFLLGLNYLALGNEERGRGYFSSAVRYDPSFLPSEDLYTRAIVRAYTDARKTSIGRIAVTSDPPGARVFVGGRAVGKTPYEGDAAVGEQSVKTELEGYTGQVRRVHVDLEKRASVKFKLSREVASAETQSAEEFQKIKLLARDGAKTNETDVTLVLEHDRLVVRANEGGSELKTLTYRDIRSAEYSYSRHPRWKEGLGATIAVGIFAAPIFFLKGKKHWLMVQTEDDYAVLRLDKNNYELVCLSFTAASDIDVELIGEK
jgi:tetratricopeptide (TPR) repeat protein